jgi:superoxide dismutase, Cu-Zn family
MKPVLFLLIATIFIISCKNEDNKTTTTEDSSGIHTDTTNKMPDSPMADSMPMPMVNHAQATITGTFPDTVVNGVATFDIDSASGKVKMKLEITIPSKSGMSVAVHFHEHGDCGNKADLAHGHWNPTNAQHGKWGSSSFHSGDIGNIKLDKAGTGRMTLTTDLWTLGGSKDKNILRKAIIVHGGMDDYKTQPSGNSGARIGCGVIQ